MSNKNSNLKIIFKKIWERLTRKRKIQILFTFIFMFIASIAEIISIGSVIPFISAVMNPTIFFQNKYLSTLILHYKINDTSELIKVVTVIFCIAALFSGIFRLILTYIQLKLGASIAIDFSSKLYNIYLHKKYIYHTLNNSSELQSKISKSGELGTWFITPILTVLSSSFMLLFVTITLFIISPYTVLSAFIIFGFVYVLLGTITKPNLKKYSKTLDFEYAKMFKSVQEGLGGIRDILLDGTQNEYSKIYKKSLIPYRKAWVGINFINQSPKFIVETIGMILIALFAAFTIAKQEFKSGIVVLGVLAMSAQRMLPLMQLIFGSIATIRGNESSILSVLIDLDFDNSINENFSIKKDKISFKKSITLQDIDFKYNIDGDFVINKLNICIKKGERIGVVGTTGSGKSTLIDIIMQLLEPTSGKLLIDNVEINKLNYQSWQSHISHVPQFIFLSDASILENIAFGVDIDNIDFERVVYSAKKAKISETIETWEKKYNTSIGERGVRISGGQRQRIGIARAFYKNAELIILDEATSALDSETENEIMRSINDFDRNLTILIIAHRVATLQKCDRIIDLSNKDIFIHDSFEEYQKSIIK